MLKYKPMTNKKIFYGIIILLLISLFSNFGLSNYYYKENNKIKKENIDSIKKLNQEIDKLILDRVYIQGQKQELENKYNKKEKEIEIIINKLNQIHIQNEKTKNIYNNSSVDDRIKLFTDLSRYNYKPRDTL